MDVAGALPASVAGPLTPLKVTQSGIVDPAEDKVVSAAQVDTLSAGLHLPDKDLRGVGVE